MNPVRKTVIGAVVVAAAMILGAPSMAQAAEACQPSDAWTETVSEAYDETVPAVTHVVHHDAVYEDVKVIDVAYQPAIPEVAEVSRVVHHEAETTVIHHDAVTHEEYHFAKFTRERSGKKVHGDIQWGGWSDWSKWSPETHTSWELDTDPIGSPQPHADWTEGNGQNKVYFERQWQARYDGQTRTVEDEPAYDETVIVKDAYDETVIDVPYQPGVPEVAEVSHVEQRLVSEAYDETVIDEPERTVHHDAVTVDHPAVVCPPTTIGTPETPEPEQRTATADVLAETGGNGSAALPWTLGAAGAILAGLAALAIRQRRKSGRGTPQ